MSESSSSWQQHPGAEAEAAADSPYSAENLRAPGLRFVPSDQELIVNYLRPKIFGHKLPTNLVQEADVYLEHPGVLTSKLGSSVEDFWYVFSSRSRKYPKGKRPSRSTGTEGRWKAVGKNVPVVLGADKDADGKAKTPEVIGHKCALAYELFVRDESSSSSRPRTAKTEWKMCEFVAYATNKPISSAPGHMLLNDWVLCRITRKAAAAAAAEAPILAHQLATIVEEPHEDEQLPQGAPPDPSSQQARAMADMPHLLDDDVVEDGEEGTEVVQTEGVGADLEPPRDGDGVGAAMEVQFVDWEYHPKSWVDGYGVAFDHDRWNQFGATPDPDPMVNRFEVPVDPDSAVSPIELLAGPQPWEIASSLLFADDSHELVEDEIVKANGDAGEARTTSTNKTSATPADADGQK